MTHSAALRHTEVIDFGEGVEVHAFAADAAHYVYTRTFQTEADAYRFAARVEERGFVDEAHWDELLSYGSRAYQDEGVEELTALAERARLPLPLD